MASEIRSRIVILAGLAALGLSLAGAGTAIGLQSPIAAYGENPAFVVNDENITYSDAGEAEIVVANISNVTTIQIDETDPNRFQIETDSEPPLTAAERDRSRRVALDNRSVQRKLSALEQYTVSVEPVRKIDQSAMKETRITALNVTEYEGGTDVFTVSEGGEETEDGSVVVEREPTHVENRTVVSVRQPAEGTGRALKYTIDVDLTTGTVTDITDWTPLR